MPAVLFADDEVVFLTLRLGLRDELTGLAEQHPSGIQATLELEQQGTQLAQAILGDVSQDEVMHFIRAVCNWGGYAGLAARVENQNTFEHIGACFLRALERLQAEPDSVGTALSEINGIRQLGSASFASKHLRFLRPELCPVMDSTISERMGYSLDPDGYQQFACVCRKVAEQLELRGVENPLQRQDGCWFPCDVEMAIYTALQRGVDENGRPMTV